MEINTLIVLVCSVLAIAKCNQSSVFIIGPKIIRPAQPYTVALVNPLRTSIPMNLTLVCNNEGAFSMTRTLKPHSAERHSLKVPQEVNIETKCTFKAFNYGGNVIVDHAVELQVASKTLSIFILTDKPVYKPGDIVRFRVVVLDMATKPVSLNDRIQIKLHHSDNLQRQWPRAVLYNGVFETGHRLSSSPKLGMWNITVTANNGNISNVKSTQFEVREYVMPKFVIKVAPSRILLISDRMISLHIESYYTFGRPVRGNITVELFLNENSRVASHSAKRIFDGSGTFSFELENELETEEDKDHAMVKVNVLLKEMFSDFTSNATKEFPVFIHPYKIALIKKATNYRPGVEYYCQVSVEDHYGIPVKDKSIKVTTDTGEEKIAKLNDQGVASLLLPMPIVGNPVEISVHFENRDYNNIDTIYGSEGTTNQYLQISLYKRTATQSSFTVKSNVKLSHLFYFVTSRGNVLFAKYVQCYMKTKFSFSIKHTIDMTVQSKLIVYTTNSGHLIMDYFDLDYFANDIKLSLEKDEFRPDEDIEISVTAAADSYVAFQAIDQGALLLGYDGFGITKTHVLEDLDEYTEDISGLFTDPNDDLIASYGLFSRTAKSTQDGSSRSKRSIHHAKRHTYSKPILLRTVFPESWLWINHTMDNNNELMIYDVVPHTITSWYVNGFALSPTRGLGLISAPKKLTVYKEFYIVANLPYSIKRNETVRIQVTLFNFLGNSLTTDVTLYSKRDEIEFVDQSSDDPSRRRKAVVVPHYQPISISFLIRARKLGEIAIKIEAANQLRSDGLEHMLRVTPESRLHTKSEARFINLPLPNTTNFDLSLDIPKAADEGSVKIDLIIDPPIVASIAENLGSLLAIPTGAANLNLMTFIPNVVILDYIKQTKKKDPLKEQTAIDYLSTGYTNQLKYRHSNGAFGQWDEPEKKPSVFLTALVANAFSTASKYIDVDKTIVTEAFSWIKGKQKGNGCFEEDGEIFYKPMQSSLVLTAFIVVSIEEINETSHQFKELVNKATNCLADKFYSLTNTHDRALATYALSLTKHAERRTYLNKLVEYSQMDDTGRYWNENFNVEIAGYALLSFIAQDMYYDAMPVMKWLNRQRYSTGAFAGVHSTFVALKALGKMAAYLTKKRNEYSVRIEHNKHLESFDVERKDTLESIKHGLPAATRKISFNIEGTGFGFLQVTYQYYLNIQANPNKTAFNLDVKVLDTSTIETQYLSVCLRHKQKEHYTTSGVTLVEVHLPSGFVVHENAVKDHNRRIRNTERAFQNTVMYVYYNEVGENQYCFDVTAHRKYQIALHRPSYVVVYDTNDWDRYAIKTYEGKVLQPCQICDSDDCKSMDC